MLLANFLKTELKKLKAGNLYRQLKNYPEKNYANFSSNNYLGKRGGLGSSRLLSPNQGLYAVLEKNIAAWKKSAAALVFPTGYMANLGTISALMTKGDLIIIDKLDHASIIDGCYLSGADLRVYKHKDMASLKKILENTNKKYKKKLIITESVFSMDGDIAPLTEIAALAQKYECWTYVDEAHAIGVFGQKGSGLINELNLEDKIDIKMGTLSKAIGGLGGYIAGSKLLSEYLVNQARSFIYTTGLPENLVRELIDNLGWLQKAEDLREKLWRNVDYFYALAVRKGLKLKKPESPIIPIIIGSEAKALALAQDLLTKGIVLPAIRYPTVPKGQARLRCTLTAEHTQEEIEFLIQNMLL